MALVVSVGAGPNQVPLIRHLRQCGHDVAAFDLDPAAPGFAYCAHHRAISTHDHIAAQDWAASLGRPAAVGCFSYGRAVATALRLAHHFALPGAIEPAIADALHDKVAQRQLLAAAGVTVPRMLQRRELSGTVVAKPATESGSSRGVRILAADAAARLGPGFVYEEHVAGDEFRLAAWFHRGEPVWIGALQRWNMPGTCLAARYRALPAAPAWAPELARRLATAARLASGLIKADVVLRDGAVVVIEVDLGICGDHLETALAPAAWSLDLVAAYTDLILGGRPRLAPGPLHQDCLDYVYREAGDDILAQRLAPLGQAYELAWQRDGIAACPPQSQRDAVAAVLHNAAHLPPGLPGRSQP